MIIKVIRFLFLWVVFLALSGHVVAQEQKINVKQLPKKARDFLQTHYEKINVATVKEEVESWFEKEYTVKLADGKEIEFDSEGNWKEIDAKRQAIPLSLIPQNIIDYVKRSFPKTEIIKLKKTTKRYEVAISNGLKLKFNSKGEFIKIDD